MARLLGAQRLPSGAVPVAKRLEQYGADYLAVACIDEAEELRAAGVRLPILIFGATAADYAVQLAELGVTQAVSSLEMARAFSEKLAAAGKTLRVHLKLETGMGRTGFDVKRGDVADAVEAVRLPGELQTQTTPVELQTLCQQVAANTPTFGYVQPSTLQLCRRAQLLSLRQQAANQTGKRWPVLLADIRADVQSGRLQKSDLLPLMTILQSRRLGDDVMPQQAIELGRLANGQEPAIELAMAGLLLEQLSSKTDSIQLEKRLLQLHQQGEKRAAYLLGRLYIEGRYRVAEPALAEQVLKDATELPEASYLLGRLYLSGLLGGQPNVQAGVDLLVQSARQGYAKADLALAEAFHDTPGVKANPVYAWVFTSLALQQHPDSLQQQRRLATLTLDSQHQQQAEALLRKERQVRIAHTIHSALPLQLVQEAETETPDEVVPDRNDMKKPDTEQKNSEKNSDEKNTEKNTELVSNF